MKEPQWLSKPAVLAFHGRLLAEHGGDTGIRDEGLLESALAAPRNKFHYGEADIFALAGTYAHSLLTNHPFVDGNKRVALVTTGVFLELNGFRLTAPEPDTVLAILALVKGEMKVEDFADWLRVSSEKT